MLVIGLQFIAGRFHANPWGHNVNEGVPEWPPSPYRLLRAIYDVWRRKRPEWPASRIEPILCKLASRPPIFHLPLARAAHTRSFLNQNERDPAKKTLIFDAFVVLSPRACVLVGWHDVLLESHEHGDLAELLSLINYIGRSESWVSIFIMPKAGDFDWNCRPADESRGPGDIVESVLVACAQPAEQYESQPLEPKKRGKRASASKLSWLDAIARSTAELLTSRRTEPPAFQHIAYWRPVKCFDPTPRSVATIRRRIVNGVLYALETDVPAPVTATIEVAEQVRRKLMGIHRKLTGNLAAISEKFSGKDSTGNPLKGHRHCFILPQDRDSDGWLDHLLVISRDPLDSDELRAMYRLESLWQRGGRPDIRCVPVQSGSFTEFTRPASRLVSATPFVTSRHYRTRRGEFTDWLVAEVRREATNHDLPQPVRVTLVPNIMVLGRYIFWRDFRRNRREDPVMPGYGFEMEFGEPILHPIALGYACHFGMGQFSPMN